MCTLFANLYILSTLGFRTVCYGDSIYILYLYDETWFELNNSGVPSPEAVDELHN